MSMLYLLRRDAPVSSFEALFAHQGVQRLLMRLTS